MFHFRVSGVTARNKMVPFNLIIIILVAFASTEASNIANVQHNIVSEANNTSNEHRRDDFESNADQEKEMAKDNGVTVKNDVMNGFQCSSFVIWHDLGNQSYPQYLREEVCGQERCFGGVFRCKPVYYTMSVLTKRKSRGQPEDARLPGTLRDDWRFEQVNVSIGCTCGL